MELMKDGALLLGVIIILGGVGWYLFNSIDVVEAPSDAVGNGSTEPLHPDQADADTATPVPPVTDVPDAPGVNSFESCVAAGNPVMESYPRQCRHQGILFVEQIDIPRLDDEVVTCSPESKLSDICTMEYAPVCGLVEVQCVTTPCPPIPETFSNGCVACGQGNVISYTPGACSVDE